ncbi:FHA domain-containing protein FhaB/FipA [Flexivirga caeni]|uniref:FHA domain-containing protein n=1 Tax=Flexivirga caeni TaxID=2294115 RepID=A0A3M9M3B1_9MICO|nr:FHA domain-containing protein [Flexivirga caeni]RNI19687.1 FHA domain-containing protein [Flexivirga caeni]
MSELTLTAIRLGLLALLWAFIFSIVSVLRGDLYGTHSAARGRGRGQSAPARAAKPARRGPTRLAIIEGPMRGGSVPLTENGVLIGRNPECTLVLSDDFASGRHARIYPGGDGWLIDDLGSTNGTYVGSERIGEGTPLPEGARVRIGQTVLEARK